MGRITGLMHCAALCHAHGIELVPHQTQPTIGHAANMRLMATAMHLAKPIEVADNPRRLNALFNNGASPGAVGSGSRPRTRKARAARQADLDAGPPVTDLRPLRRGRPDAATFVAPR
jgi:hypothetical protein